MAFPYLFESNWQVGDLLEWDTETDTQAKLSNDHYVTLAHKRLTPWRGNYGMHIDQSIGTITTAATLTETASFDTALGGTIYLAFAFMVKDLVMAASDTITLFSLDSAGPVVEVMAAIVNNAGVYEIQAGDGTTARAATLVQDQWHWVELACLIDSGVGDDGTIDFYVDGVQVGAQITGVDQAAISQARLGAHTITHTGSGHILFGPVIADDARVFPQLERWPTAINATKSATIFVGPGAISAAVLLSSTVGNTMDLYDTDLSQSTSVLSKKVELSLTASTSFTGPIQFEKGCYCVLGGTNPRGQVLLADGSDLFGNNPTGPIAYGSDGAIRTWALRGRR